MAKLQHHAIVTISVLGNKYLSSSKQIRRTFKFKQTNTADFQIQTNKYGKHSNICLLGTLNTNHSNVEHALLSKENLQHTVRLLISIDIDEPQATQVLQELYNECPSLFDALLPRSEQADFFKQVADDSLLMLLPSTDHLKPAVIGRISTTHCRDQLNLPTRSSQLDFGFKNQDRASYSL